VSGARTGNHMAARHVAQGTLEYGAQANLKTPGQKVICGLSARTLTRHEEYLRRLSDGQIRNIEGIATDEDAT
jgi:hypothetical protein